MASNKHINPHDAYIKKYLQDPVAARHFLEAHISQEIVQRIDFDTLTLTNKSFVKDDNTEIHSDIVFRFKFKDGQRGYIFTLLEHLSSPLRDIPARMIEYVQELLKSDKREHKTVKDYKWPVVIPIIFYNGKQSPYPYATNAYDCTSDPALARSVGMFEGGKLVDVTIMDDASLDKHKTVALMEKAMKYCRTRELFNKLKEYFQTTIQPLEKHFIVFTLEYSLYTSDDRKISKEKLVSLFEEQLNKEDIMTIAKRIEQQGIQRGIQEGIQRGREEGIQRGREEGIQRGREEGIQRGREEGIQRGREEGIQRGREEGILETAKNLIQQGIPLDVIAKATGLSKKELAQLS